MPTCVLQPLSIAASQNLWLAPHCRGTANGLSSSLAVPLGHPLVRPDEFVCLRVSPLPATVSTVLDVCPVD